MKERHYFFVPNAADAQELPPDEAKHALRVLRVKAGDALWLMFHAKDKATHAWRYRALRDALSSLEGTAAFSEFDHLVRQVFG